MHTPEVNIKLLTEQACWLGKDDWPLSLGKSPRESPWFWDYKHTPPCLAFHFSSCGRTFATVVRFFSLSFVFKLMLEFLMHSFTLLPLVSPLGPYFFSVSMYPSLMSSPSAFLGWRFCCSFLGPWSFAQWKIFMQMWFPFPFFPYPMNSLCSLDLQENFPSTMAKTFLTPLIPDPEPTLASCSWRIIAPLKHYYSPAAPSSSNSNNPSPAHNAHKKHFPCLGTGANIARMIS